MASMPQPNAVPQGQPANPFADIKGQSVKLQVKALLKKSLVIQMRQYKTNAFQIIFSLLMIILLFVIQIIVNSIVASSYGKSVPAVEHPSKQDIPLLFYDKFAEQCSKVPTAVTLDASRQLLVSTNGLAGIVSGLLARIIYPQTPFGNGFGAYGAFKQYANGGAPPTFCYQKPYLLTKLNFVEQATSQQAQNYIYQSFANQDKELLGGFDFTQFDAVNSVANYNIMVNKTFTQSQDFGALTSMMTNAVYLEFAAAAGKPLTSLTQLLMTGTKGFPEPERPIEFDLVSVIGPSIYIYVFPLLLPTFIGAIVSEKELKLREIMLLMGLRPSVYFCVTYFFNYFLYALSTTFVLICVNIMQFRLFTLNAFGAYFILLFLWGHVQCALAFLLSVFFTKSRAATVVGYLLVFGFGIIAQNLSTYFQEGADKTLMFFLTLIPSFTLYRGFLELANSVILGGTGLAMSDLSAPDVYLDQVYVFMVVQWFVFLVLAYYLEKVVPTEGGIKKDPLFCLRGSVLPDTRKSQHSIIEMNPSVAPGPDVIEQKSLAFDNSKPAAIRIQNLRKVFPLGSTGKELVAVKDLSMVIKYGECLGFLGSNGAGKTTTISMLCGYVMPSSGTATIYGADIVDDSDRIHMIMGVCTQENVIWPDMTGGEHLEFYGRLKGLEGQNLEKAIVSGLKSVDLHEVRNKGAGQYSGGMKRRLCVASALIGNPKVVLLDEPTTGLDPAARRQLWGVINEHKKHCAMLLTTHSMEEAENLTDVVAIFERGELRVIGTSTELKLRFENGFKMTVTSPTTKNETEIKEFVKRICNDSILLNSLGGTLNFEIPTESAHLSHIFKEMNDNAERLDIEDWCISNTTLEEVFVQIATGQHEVEQK